MPRASHLRLGLQVASWDALADASGFQAGQPTEAELTKRASSSGSQPRAKIQGQKRFAQSRIAVQRGQLAQREPAGPEPGYWARGYLIDGLHLHGVGSAT